jgi:hypothetical protein
MVRACNSAFHAVRASKVARGLPVPAEERVAIEKSSVEEYLRLEIGSWESPSAGINDPRCREEMPPEFLS